jgi:energy-coupling factor transporter ATP-binding protein EcfA2
MEVTSIMYTESVFSNKPILNLKKNNDLLGNIERANFIQNFLESNDSFIRENNMLALFGSWGSGKTTLIYSIKNNIDEKMYFPIIFNAWKYEKDGNLAFSLYEHLLDTINLEKEKIKKAKKIGKIALKGTLKSINIIGKIFEEYEKNKEEIEDSLYKKVSEFENNFCQIIEEFYEKNKKYLIVFIDDLDRCEPENILNLLSSMKLLLTSNIVKNLEKRESKIIYFCGIDKDAVIQAARIRFGDKIKAEEYLEKIFDISFNMPKSYNTEKIVKHYIPYMGDEIVIFFNKIGFSNPRHIKKILNKYKMISLIKNSNMNKKYKDLIPEILIEETGCIFDTLLVLFFLILHEFYYGKFIELKNYDSKFENYLEYLTDELKEISRQARKNNINLFLKGNQAFFSFKKMKDIKFLMQESSTGVKPIFKLLSIFTPRINRKFVLRLGDIEYFEQFEYEGNEILINFCKFIYKDIENILINDTENKSADYNVFNLFEMCEKLL